MAGKKNSDATKNLPEGEPTQVLPQGTTVGLPKREDVFAALEKVAKKPRKLRESLPSDAAPTILD